MEMNNFNDILPYSLGGLLYTPATNSAMADKIINKEYPCLTAVSFCLEDAILDTATEQAELTLCETLRKLSSSNADLPYLFVRVRSPEQLERMHSLLGGYEKILTGYIFPKFDIFNGSKYLKSISRFNENRKQTLYAMPILESRAISDKNVRTDNLSGIKSLLDSYKKYVLNIRVGGNDFSNIYGLRRTATQTIYDIGVIRDILIDVINVFAAEYVVSGPVWEYFGDNTADEWCKGLKHELELDKLNGFIGKTAIHPTQLPIIFDSLKVSRADYEDAVKILDWQPEVAAVEKSSGGNRMNEVKCHTRWAERIQILARVYGIKD
ncbi:MAG: HpcH/HpaI aldolase/citrate lyase family protein [Oscillospiraceae bacterium]|nr:HpcH/HpaI aldolase/citrate lyase family protein [Oscillospiraceae bacterium]